MRDLVLCLIFLASIPYMLKRPSLGILMWIWLSVMNPHRLAYGFAYSLNFAAAAAGITLIALFTTKDKRQLPLTAPVIALACFTLWMCVTSLFPIHPGSGYGMWSRVMKIMLMTFVAFAVIHERKQIDWVVWIIVFSLAFFGAKGGVFTLTSGGSYLVWGPSGSFIEGNNELALALVVVIPLLRYVQMQLQKPWQRRGLTAVMVLCAVSAVGSHSRGALLAIGAMGGFLWIKSRNKFGMGIVLVVVGFAVVAFMPENWMSRMSTIRSYEEDGSAMGRINAWWMAYNLAKSNFFGGGFEIYDAVTFGRYAPNPIDIHAAHSIYFQVLGEHGFVGLFLYLAVGVFTWLAAGQAKRAARDVPDLLWAAQLMDMVKVSMVGFAVGGAFLSLAYFDVPYYLTVIVVATRSYALEFRKTWKPAVQSSRRRTAFDPPPRDAGWTPTPEVAVPALGTARGNWRGQGDLLRGPARRAASERP